MVLTADLNVLGPSSLDDVASTSMELESEVGSWGACPLELLAWLTSGEKEEKEEGGDSPVIQVKS